MGSAIVNPQYIIGHQAISDVRQKPSCQCLLHLISNRSHTVEGYLQSCGEDMTPKIYWRRSTTIGKVTLRERTDKKIRGYVFVLNQTLALTAETSVDTTW